MAKHVNLRQHKDGEQSDIIALFRSVFTDSEGESEGALIGELAENLFATTDDRDLFNYVAMADERVVGSIFFTRLRFGDTNDSFMLAPVAVHSDRQREGIGQALINHGLADLRSRGVSAVLTYGDPAYYQKVGFHQISPKIIEPPFELSQPIGWLGQSLLDRGIESLSGRCACVSAFDDPLYW